MKSVWRRLVVVALLALLCLSVAVSARRSRRDLDDEDEFEGGDVASVGATGGAVGASSRIGEFAGTGLAEEEEEEEEGDDDGFEADDEFADDAPGSSSLSFADEEEAEATPAAAGASTTPADQAREARGLSAITDFSTFYLEYLAVGFIVLFVLAFIQGRSANEAIAAAFEKQFTALFQSQFAEIVGKDPNRSLLSKTSMNSFKGFATGRRGCRGVMIEIDLVKRQNLIDVMMGLFASNEEDLVTLTIPKAKMEPFVLALVAKKCRKRVHSAVPNLAKYARARDTPDKVCAVLRDAEKFLRVIHFSDEAALADASVHLAPCELRFQFALPPASKMAAIADLMELALMHIDVVSAATLSGSAKRVSERQRKIREAIRNKERRSERAAQQKQRVEEKMAKEQEAYDKMTPKQRAKWDAKRDAKRARKMRRPRMKMKM